MHDSGSKDIFIPPVVAKGFTFKVTQLIVNPRCNVARSSYEVFHDRVDQGVDFIRNSSSYALVKDGRFFPHLLTSNVYVLFTFRLPTLRGTQRVLEQELIVVNKAT